jgi:hypothetical protein
MTLAGWSYESAKERNDKELSVTMHAACALVEGEGAMNKNGSKNRVRGGACTCASPAVAHDRSQLHQNL